VSERTSEVQYRLFDLVFKRKKSHTNPFTGLHFWSRGYCVSTIGLDEEVIRKYIRDQEKLEKQQLDLELD
jgi:putative transposase